MIEITKYKLSKLQNKHYLFCQLSLCFCLIIGIYFLQIHYKFIGDSHGSYIINNGNDNDKNDKLDRVQHIERYTHKKILLIQPIAKDELTNVKNKTTLDFHDSGGNNKEDESANQEQEQEQEQDQNQELQKQHANANANANAAETDAEMEIDADVDVAHIINPWTDILLDSDEKSHHWNVNKLQDEFGITEKRMRDICDKTYWNSWQTTIDFLIDNTTFMITGDIKDMWIRDSTEQIFPYLPLISKYDFVNKVIYGLILKQAQYIIAEPYANSYKKEEYCYHSQTHSLRKYTSNYIATKDLEIDSGCFFVKLVYFYHRLALKIKKRNMKMTMTMEKPRTRIEYKEILDEPLVTQALHVLFELWFTELQHNAQSPYKYSQNNKKRKEPKSKDYCGMIWSSNRPSDDLCRYNFHIPNNFFLHQTLDYVKYFARFSESLNTNALMQWQFASNVDVGMESQSKPEPGTTHTHAHNHSLIELSDILQTHIYNGIHKYGVQRNYKNKFGDIYCYETNALGDCLVMDDANIPSLISIPIITDKYNRTIYENTRKVLLSAENPYYFRDSSTNVKGIGSPHTPENRVWPLSLITQGFTVNNDANADTDADGNENERYAILKMLMENTGNTNLMHESFDVKNDKMFTRSWFAWANSYFSLYANCLEQFMDMSDDKNVAKILNKEKYSVGEKHSIGSLTSTQTHKQPQQISYIDPCKSHRINGKGDCIGKYCNGR